MSYQNRYFNGCEYINYNYIDRYVMKGGKEVFLKREEIKNKSILGKIEHFFRCSNNFLCRWLYKKIRNYNKTQRKQKIVS